MARSAAPFSPRPSSEHSSWQEVLRCEHGGSSEDLTDMEDPGCVSLAPRLPIRTCSVHLPPIKAKAFAAAARPAAAPPPAAPPASVTMRRAEGQPDAVRSGGTAQEAEARPALRMRRTPSSVRLGSPVATGGAGGTSGRGLGGGCLGVPVDDSGRSLCGLNTDGDVFWTFLAGMLVNVVAVGV